MGGGGGGRCAQLRVYEHNMTGARSAQARITANSLVLKKCIAKWILSWQNIGFLQCFICFIPCTRWRAASRITDICGRLLAGMAVVIWKIGCWKAMAASRWRIGSINSWHGAGCRQVCQLEKLQCNTGMLYHSRLEPEISAGIGLQAEQLKDRTGCYSKC